LSNIGYALFIMNGAATGTPLKVGVHVNGGLVNMAVEARAAAQVIGLVNPLLNVANIKFR
jgi:hypothetical protein